MLTFRFSVAIDDFSALTPDHVPLLREMEEVGRNLQNTLTAGKKIRFRMGFHAIPSMKQLHMHLISQDFESDALKNKKHWNSFTTRFFVDSNRFIGILEDQGSIFFDKKEYEALLSSDLKCCFCGASIGNMPTLKDHIRKCPKRPK